MDSLAFLLQGVWKMYTQKVRMIEGTNYGNIRKFSELGSPHLGSIDHQKCDVWFSRSGDQGGQAIGSSQPIHLFWNVSLRYSAAVGRKDLDFHHPETTCTVSLQDVHLAVVQRGFPQMLPLRRSESR